MVSNANIFHSTLATLSTNATLASHTADMASLLCDLMRSLSFLLPHWKKPRSLEELPDDVLIEVSGWLDPKCVLRLRMTCRRFHTIAEQHAVWLSVLRRQCYKNYIPLSTYPLAKMTAAQLERATLMPYTFIGKLASDDPLCIGERIAFPLNGIRFWDKMSVLPGGRYILATLGTRIVFYDVGRYMSSEGNRRPTVKFFWNLGRRIIQLQSAPRSYNKFQICVVTETDAHGHQNTNCNVLLLVLDDASETAELLNMGSIPVQTIDPSPPFLYQVVRSNIIVIAGRGGLTTWNFVQKTIGFNTWSQDRIEHMWADETYVVVVESHLNPTSTTPRAGQTVINVYSTPAMSLGNPENLTTPATLVSTKHMSTRYLLAGVKVALRPLHAKAMDHDDFPLMRMDDQGTFTVYRTCSTTGTQDPAHSSPVDVLPVLRSARSQQPDPLGLLGSPRVLAPIKHYMVDRSLVQVYCRREDQMLTASVTRLTETPRDPGEPEARPSRVISKISRIFSTTYTPTVGDGSSWDIDPWQACIYVVNDGVLRICDFANHSP